MRKVANENFNKIGGGWEFEIDEADGVGLFWLNADEVNHLLNNGYKLHFVDIEDNECLCEVSAVDDSGVYAEVTYDKMTEIFS